MYSLSITEYQEFEVYLKKTCGKSYWKLSQKSADFFFVNPAQVVEKKWNKKTCNMSQTSLNRKLDFMKNNW